MIPGDQIVTNPRVTQLVHLPDKEQSGIEVTPVAVVEIASNHHKIDPLLNRQLNQIFERPSARAANQIDGSPFVGFEPFQGTVQVQIRSV